MSWAYNDIDVYLTETRDDQYFEPAVNEYWTPVSDYGIVRSRVVLTPSTYDGNQVTIPGRDGRPYETDRSRGNAKIEFEVLVVDSWVFASSQSSVRERADELMALINRARRISYKQPGKPAEGYFLIYKTTLTVTDADEKAIVVKVSLEVHPYEWLFSGNQGLYISPNETKTIVIPQRCNVAMPYLELNGVGTLRVSGSNDYLEKSEGGAVHIDTWRFTAEYWPSRNSANLILSGDYDSLWLKPGENLVTSGLTEMSRIRTRMGIIR